VIRPSDRAPPRALGIDPRGCPPRPAGALDTWLGEQTRPTPGVALLVSDRVWGPAGAVDPVEVHERKFAFEQICRRVVGAYDGRVLALSGFPRSTEHNNHRVALGAGRCWRPTRPSSAIRTAPARRPAR
jgi:hypothetical protein